MNTYIVKIYDQLSPCGFKTFDERVALKSFLLCFESGRGTDPHDSHVTLRIRNEVSKSTKYKYIIISKSCSTTHSFVVTVIKQYIILTLNIKHILQWK